MRTTTGFVREGLRGRVIVDVYSLYYFEMDSNIAMGFRYKQSAETTLCRRHGPTAVMIPLAT